MKRAGVFLFVVFVLYVLNAFLNPFPVRNTTLGYKPNYGFSYSFERARWMGLDARGAYADLLSTADFKWVRLPFFWSSMATINADGTVTFTKDFDDLKFALEQAKDHNTKVIVNLGAKTIYYPEYHLPSVEAAKLKFGQTIDSKSPIVPNLIKVDKAVVEALGSYDNIAYWQIENEPLLANVNNLKISPDLISLEASVVKQADPLHRPVILNHVGPSAVDAAWKSLLPLLGQNDIFGVNAYFKTKGTNLVTFAILGKTIMIPWPDFAWWPVQSWLFLSPDYSNLRKEVSLHNSDLWVLEMQAEPYIRDINETNPMYSYSAADIEKASQFLTDSRISNVGLWGSEFWEYRKAKGDSTWIQTVKAIVD